MKKILSCIVLGSSLCLVGCEAEIKEETVEVVHVPQVVVREARGTVEIEDREHFYLEFPAVVTEVLVKEGESVEAGQVLMTLDTSTFDNTLAQLINEKAIYERELDGLSYQMYPQYVYINQLKTDLVTKESILAEGTGEDYRLLLSTEALLESQKIDLLDELESAQALLAVGGIAEQECDVIEENIAVKDRAIEDINLQIEALKKQKQQEIDSIKTQISDLEIQVANSVREVETAQATLGLQIEAVNLQIVAMEEKKNKPFLKGNDIIATESQHFVYDLMATKGTQTNSVSGPLFKTANMNERIIVADVPEEYSGDLEIGSVVEVVPYIDEEYILEGTVVRIAEQAEEQYGEIIVKTYIEVEDVENRLKVGSSVDILF